MKQAPYKHFLLWSFCQSVFYLPFTTCLSLTCRLEQPGTGPPIFRLADDLLYQLFTPNFLFLKFPEVFVTCPIGLFWCFSLVMFTFTDIISILPVYSHQRQVQHFEPILDLLSVYFAMEQQVRRLHLRLVSQLSNYL